ncbi:hypothetical protein [Adhaeretor mobilis]|uniref:Uncharacterized protein n=1 Tax=Adhaeretor mobilis TaxID=1930276 RepID=A0A517MWP1_9BACT|nr:hypothetical protein [Adhaeretor mobilis]QDS99295.1 hypothetical protein HG15A2_26170 [Adhaeretor mobilis]
MSAPDFYFAVNATARHINDAYGMESLIDYWRSLGEEFYQKRCEKWRTGGLAEIAEDWRQYFLQEPGAVVETSVDESAARLDIRVCPAIKHLRDSGREIVPYYCEHCDHTCGSMAETAGYRFSRTGGMGACQQVFTKAEDSEGN